MSLKGFERLWLFGDGKNDDNKTERKEKDGIL